MSNKKKLTKAAVAVMAVGGVAVVASPSDIAANSKSPFIDVSESSYYYEDVLELYKRGVIHGVGNGKFMPDSSVTRGQAAKMLASTLNLDIINIKNPNFKDVSSNNIYYPYIAALAEKGVINGFGDGTFRPDEVITRSQMATIVVKGFEFAQATNLNHSFKDVSSKDFYAPYIQTLVNLNVTKGTSAVSFSPSSTVTRGQMASFLMRAEKVEVGKNETMLITNVQSANNNLYVYVNGIKHNVDPKLSNVLNAANGEALKGAQIEGEVSGTTIQTIEKITFKAVGTSNKPLKFDGKGSTFNGSVEITGDNLHFSNWNVNGTISIKEPGRKSLAEYVNPTAKSLNASVSNGFIDWGKTTEEENSNSAGLTPIDPDFKPTLPILKDVIHNIKFENVTMTSLIIDSDKASISSNKKFSNVRVTGYVREFEIFADITDLYIESNENVTFYGSSNVGTLYKNSQKNLTLQAESMTDLLIVDNKYGWIDLGYFYYINKVIIPEGYQVYEVFGDFLNDEKNINIIEDSTGAEVDRDFIENIIIPDVTPPTLSIKDVTTNLASTNITFHSNEDAKIYYVIKTQKEKEPTMREVLQYVGSMGGSRDISENEEILVHIPYLQDKQQYVVYAIAVDNAGNVSRIQNKKFEIIDATPPVIKSASIKGLPGGKRLQVSITPDEPGEYFYYYEPLPSSGANNYTSKEIFDFEKINYRNQTGKGKVNEAGKMEFVIPGLESLTKYAVYVVMKDKYGNEIKSPKVLTGITEKLDEVHPYITDGELYPVNKDYYEFEINVNEELDPETANDINNYELSGTAILNIAGQPTTIKPDSVTYVKGSKKIRIRVPSATALVNGDTIVVKILKNVKDLAGNEFINIDVVETAEEVKNTASYIFSDNLEPSLTIEKFQLNPSKTSGILTYKANKAGTYYYMIVPNNYDMNSVSKRDFYNEFTSYPTLSNDKRIPFLVKQGQDGNNNVVVGTQTNNVILQNPDNPFESYSLYMVMKDRSGNLSEIQKVENVINDSRAPFVQSFSARAKEGADTIAEITLQASEAGTLFYTRLEKKVLDKTTGQMIDNPEIQEIRNWHTVLNNKKENHSLLNNEAASQYVSKIRTWKNTKLQKDILTKFEDGNLKAHTEYVYFFAVQDAFGNITMYAENTDTADKTDYASNQMETNVYTDGIAPTLDPIIKLIRKPELDNISIQKTYSDPNETFGDGVISHIPEKTFIMTFSEAIKYSGTLASGQTELEKLASTIENSMGVIIEDMEWEKTSSTADQRKLVFTVKDIPTRDVAVDTLTLTGFTDLGKPNGKPFADRTAARYLEPGSDLNTIAYAQLIGDVKGPLVNHLGEERYESQSVILGMELNVRNDVKQRYYFITQTKDSSELNSFEDVVNVAENPFYGGYRGIGIVGSGDVSRDITSGGTNDYSRSLTINSGSGVFMSSQKLYLVTMDEYGNIVGVQGGVKFVPIIK